MGRKWDAIHIPIFNPVQTHWHSMKTHWTTPWHGHRRTPCLIRFFRHEFSGWVWWVHPNLTYPLGLKNSPLVALTTGRWTHDWITSLDGQSGYSQATPHAGVEGLPLVVGGPAGLVRETSAAVGTMPVCRRTQGGQGEQDQGDESVCHAARLRYVLQ